MTGRWTGYGLTLVAGLMVATASSPGAPPVLCSVFTHGRLPDTTSTYLLAKAMPDTVATGAGAVEPAGGPGHTGAGRTRTVYGQLVRVERLGGADSATVAGVLAERSDSTVVLVPWDYDPSCRPTFWNGSARWVPVGEEGAFRKARLRPPAQWVDGTPTFDVFLAALEPYPLGLRHRREAERAEDRDRGRRLTAGEYYELYSALPPSHLVNGRPDAALALVADWERRNPDLPAVPPAPDVLGHARGLIRQAFTRNYLDGIDPAVAGTWRFTFSLDGGEERTFHARTRPRPTTPWSTGQRAERFDPRLPPPLPEGYHMLASGAPSRNALPGDCREDRQMDAEGYVMVADPAGPAREERAEWIGQAEIALLARTFPSDSALAAFQNAYFQERYRERPDGLPPEVDGVFRRGADGVIRFRQVSSLRDGRTLTLEGERLSSRTIDCSW